MPLADGGTRYLDSISIRLRHSQIVHVHSSSIDSGRYSQGGQSIARMGMGYRKEKAEDCQAVNSEELIRIRENVSTQYNLVSKIAALAHM